MVPVHCYKIQHKLPQQNAFSAKLSLDRLAIQAALWLNASRRGTCLLPGFRLTSNPAIGKIIRVATSYSTRQRHTAIESQYL